MTQKEKIELANKFLNLEVKCRYGINVPENMESMTKLAENLSLEDLFELANYMENMTWHF